MLFFLWVLSFYPVRTTGQVVVQIFKLRHYCKLHNYLITFYYEIVGY